MQRPDQAPEAVDTDRPSVARMYDYYLGGAQNFAIDRATARTVIDEAPDAPLIAQANRAFLRRVVRFLAETGTRQFLDIGSGIPSVGNVHEIAQATDPSSRVVYVDLDPVAVARSREILADNGQATAVRGDLRRPELILADPQVRGLLDFARPLAVLVVGVLHFIPDEAAPADILGTLRDALAPGSHLALSQVSAEGREPHEGAETIRIYRDMDQPLFPRTRAELIRLFAGFQLLDPGVVWVPQWRPESPDGTEEAHRAVYRGGVGRLSG